MDNEEQRGSNGRFVKGMKRSEESRRKQGETLKNQYRDGRRKAWNEGQTKETNSSIAAQAEKMIGQEPWNKGKKTKDDPRLARLIRRAAKTRKESGWKMPESARQALSAHWKNKVDECRERRKKQHFKKTGNGLEKTMWAALERVGIIFEKNPTLVGKSGRKYHRDILIASILNVECDGTYWHSPEKKPHIAFRDVVTDHDLEQNEYLIVRLKEKDIRKNADGLAVWIRDRWLSQLPKRGTENGS